MGKLQTKNLGGDAISKMIEPGNIQATIRELKLEESRFKPGAYNIVLLLEGPDMGPTFEGFSKDKNDPTSEKYKGQIGYVRMSEWPYQDGTTKSGVAIKMEDEILKSIRRLCMEVGLEQWFNDQDGVHDSIEEFANAFSKEVSKKDNFINWCLAGREYASKKGYINYDLYLPKATRMSVTFERKTQKVSKLMKFDQNVHIKRTEPKEIDNFGTDTEIPESDDLAL